MGKIPGLEKNSLNDVTCQRGAKVKYKLMNDKGFTMLHTIINVHLAEKSGLLKKMADQGYASNKGKWSRDEEEQLRQNMRDFLSEYNLTSYEKLMHPVSKEERDFKRKSEFKLKMCRFINRYFQNVNNKCETLFCDYITRGLLGREEKEEFIKLLSQHGKDIALIAKIMHKSRYDLHNTFNKMRVEGLKFDRSHTWSFDEIDKLREACKKRETLTWRSISEIVGTRSAEQCRHKWAILNSTSWNNDCSKKLFKLIQCSNFEFESGVDWYKLRDAFCRQFSMDFLRKKFEELKIELLDFDKLPFCKALKRLDKIIGSSKNDYNVNEIDQPIINEIAETNSNRENDEINNMLSSKDNSQNVVQIPTSEDGECFSTQKYPSGEKQSAKNNYIYITNPIIHGQIGPITISSDEDEEDDVIKILESSDENLETCEIIENSDVISKKKKKRKRKKPETSEIIENSDVISKKKKKDKREKPETSEITENSDLISKKKKKDKREKPETSEVIENSDVISKKKKIRKRKKPETSEIIENSDVIRKKKKKDKRKKPETSEIIENSDVISKKKKKDKREKPETSEMTENSDVISKKKKKDKREKPETSKIIENSDVISKNKKKHKREKPETSEIIENSNVTGKNKKKHKREKPETSEIIENSNVIGKKKKKHKREKPETSEIIENSDVIGKKKKKHKREKPETSEIIENSDVIGKKKKKHKREKPETSEIIENSDVISKKKKKHKREKPDSSEIIENSDVINKKKKKDKREKPETSEIIANSDANKEPKTTNYLKFYNKKDKTLLKLCC